MTLIILDRDGVLNEMVIDAEHGFIDSPLHPDQVRLLPGVAEALAQLTQAGFQLAIATNQPSAAKGKTSRKNLELVHARVLQEITRAGGVIQSSHICFHTSQDQCLCRKPKPGLLEEALKGVPPKDRRSCWMVGDGVTDVEAGNAAGVQTAFLGPQKCDACKIFEKKELKPDFWGSSLVDFTSHLL